MARHLASLVGTEAATLAVSTLHLFWDLFGRVRHALINNKAQSLITGHIK